MGRWEYYIVKMNMRELSESVKFASDVHGNYTLDTMLQRALSESRVRTEIVTYLAKQKDRFFASIVIAALKGHPKWYPVLMEGDERFTMLKDDERFNETFGVLAFDGTQQYYALDGQHRLSAIKTLISPEEDTFDPPEGFYEEEVSVLVVVPSGAETETEFFERYRRLFGHLNRYAKSMDQFTNVVMDEDDAFAILTRRLIADYEFFAQPGTIKPEKGKNLRESDPWFTSLETFYDMNRTLLDSRGRQNAKWGPEKDDIKQFQRFRPSDELLDALYDELKTYWDCLLDEMPVLKEDPMMMRRHNVPSDDESDGAKDLLVFWPIGQQLLATVARYALDQRMPESTEKVERKTVKSALAGLGEAEWDLHNPPWQYLLLVWDTEKESWRMRSEDRADAVKFGTRLQEWLLGLYPADEALEEELRRGWESRLIPAQKADDVAKMWDEVLDQQAAQVR
jgi:DGQHR domain-containing protein